MSSRWWIFGSCAQHTMPNNRFSKSLLEDTLSTLGFQTGITHQRSRPGSRAYRERCQGSR
jgi:hypothetical protein